MAGPRRRLGTKPRSPTGQDPPSESQARNRPRIDLPFWEKLAFAIPTVLGILLALELVLRACGVPSATHRRDPSAGSPPRCPTSRLRPRPTAPRWSRSPRIGARRSTTSASRGSSHPAPSGSFAWEAQQPTAVPSSTIPRSRDGSVALLPKADPSLKWEVINAGAISYVSYRIKALMAELARYKPDMLIF